MNCQSLSNKKYSLVQSIKQFRIARFGTYIISIIKKNIHISEYNMETVQRIEAYRVKGAFALQHRPFSHS